MIFIYFKLLFVATVLGEILENLKEQETEKQQMKSIDMETEFMQDDSSALPSKTSHNWNRNWKRSKYIFSNSFEQGFETLEPKFESNKNKFETQMKQTIARSKKMAQ